MEGYDNIGFDNFDPDALAQQTSEVILFTTVIDTSGSIYGYVDAMNNATRDLFMKELSGSHKADQIVVKSLEFNDSVIHKSGFMPIKNLPSDYLEVKNAGGMTALYQGVLEAYENLESYRNDLEDQGIVCKSNIFIVTDGSDNSSPRDAAAKVKAKIEELRKNESWVNTFTITMLGVGPDTKMFEKSCREMGLDPSKCLVTTADPSKDIRKVMGVVSQSVSSSNQAQVVSF